MEKVIYYVDNDSDDLTLFLYAARSMDYNVKLFKSGEQVLENLRECTEIPTVIFVDLHMPRLSGHEVITQLRNIKGLENLPIIAISTAMDDMTIAIARKSGATSFTTKPSVIRQLKKLIDYAVTNDWAEANGNGFVLKF